jgi:hypothetical protein
LEVATAGGGGGCRSCVLGSEAALSEPEMREAVLATGVVLAAGALFAWWAQRRRQEAHGRVVRTKDDKLGRERLELIVCRTDDARGVSRESVCRCACGGGTLRSARAAMGPVCVGERVRASSWRDGDVMRATRAQGVCRRARGLGSGGDSA